MTEPSVIQKLNWNRRRGPSRAFVCIVIGLALTIVGRIAGWSWAVWPATALLDLYLSRVQPSVVSGNVKAVGWLLLLLVNVGFWALIAAAIWMVWRRARSGRFGKRRKHG